MARKFYIVLLVISVVAISGCSGAKNEFVHEHADFKVYIDGQQYNFSQQRFISVNGEELSEAVHLHNIDGEVIHKHSNGVTLGDFFESLKFKFNSTCFATDNGTFCNGGGKEVKMFVNGVRNYQFEEYEIMDLNRILISFGNQSEDELKAQVSSVSDRACIYSETCPERGKPPDESGCVGGSVCSA